MKPDGKAYEEPVVIDKIWEEIDKSHHLVTKPVSDHIRKLEADKKELVKFISVYTHPRFFHNSKLLDSIV